MQKSLCFVGIDCLICTCFSLDVKQPSKHVLCTVNVNARVWLIVTGIVEVASVICGLASEQSSSISNIPIIFCSQWFFPKLYCIVYLPIQSYQPLSL